VAPFLVELLNRSLGCSFHLRLKHRSVPIQEVRHRQGKHANICETGKYQSYQICCALLHRLNITYDLSGCRRQQVTSYVDGSAQSVRCGQDTLKTLRVLFGIPVFCKHGRFIVFH